MRALIVEKIAFVEAEISVRSEQWLKSWGKLPASGIRVRLYEAPGAALLITRWIKSGGNQLPPSSCREGQGEEPGARIQESGGHWG